MNDNYGDFVMDLSQLMELLSNYGWIVGIVGIILAIYFYFKNKKIKEPVYALRDLNLIKDLINTPEALEMFYAGNKINNLSVAKIAFWNAGRDTINEKDIAKADPLAIY